MADDFDPDQYIESFDPDQYLGQRDGEATSEQSAPTQGFDPDKYIQSFDPDAYLKGRSEPQDKPQPESELQTFSREAAHAVVPAAGGFIAGAGAGALAGSVVPGWGTLAGAVVGGLAGAYGTDWAQDKVLKASGYDDSAQRQANLEVNPKSAFAGQLAPAAAAMRFDRAAPIVARAISGGLMGGIEAGQELYNEGKVSPGKVLAAGAVGAVLPTPNRVGRALEATGQRIAGRPNVVANPEAMPAKEEAAGQTPASSDTVGNPQSAPERSDRVYAKDTAGEAPQGDILTTGDVDPTVAAALGAQEAPTPPTRPVSAAPTPVESPQGPAPLSLMQFIAQNGGIKPNDEIGALDLNGSNRVQIPGQKGFFGVVRPEGADHDYMRNLAQQNGYFPKDVEGAGGNTDRTLREFYDAIDAEHNRKSPLYPEGHEGYQTKQQQSLAREREEHERLLDEETYGEHRRAIDVEYPDTPTDLRDHAAKLMAHDNLSVDDAVEAAAKHLVAHDTDYGETPHSIDATFGPGTHHETQAEAARRDREALARASENRARPEEGREAEGLGESVPEAGTPSRPQAEDSRPELALSRAKEGEKVTGEVGGGEPPQEPPSGGSKEPLKPPPPEGKATKEDLETGVWPTIQRMVGGRSSPSWKAAQKNILGKHGEAEQTRQTDQARFTNAMHRMMNETSPAEQRMLVNHMQGGDAFPTYKPGEGLKDIVSKIREGYRDFENTMRGMTDFEKMQFWDNDKYLTAQYKNPEAAREYFKEFSKAGGSGSTKKRFFPTDEDARKAGLEPISTNPIERFLRYSDAMSNHLAYKQIIREGKDAGYIKYYSPETVAGAGTPDPYVKGKPPEGWAPIDGMKNAGGAQAYAPRDYAAAMNNFHGVGLGGRSSEMRNLVSSVRRASNAFTAMELGIATYHAFTTVHERTASAWATALHQAAGGDMAAAGKTFAKSLAAPITSVKIGKRWQDLYNGTAKDGTPQEMAIIDGMKAANFKPINAKHALDYEMSKAGSLYTSIVRGSLKHEMIAEYKNIVGDKNWKEGMTFIPRNAARMMQTIAQPLFEFYIPRMKTAAFAENLKAWMDANPDYKVSDMHEVAIKIGKSIDNRMGEMAHDNMLMNRTLRDAGSLALRSFSFTIGGVFREIGGGTQSLVRGALKGENRLSLTSKQYDPRTAYALAFPLAVASMSMLYQFIKTGKGPEEWRDLVYPKTGGEQPGNGKGRLVPERVLLPGYHKDIMAYFAHPGKEAWNKLAGLWQAIYDQGRGKKMTEIGDVPIVPPNASFGEAALARAKAFGEKALPIFVKTATQDPRLTSRISYPEQLLGFRSPGKWAADAEGQHIADEKRSQREWDSAQKRLNADRVSRGLERLPPRERNPNP